MIKFKKQRCMQIIVGTSELLVPWLKRKKSIAVGNSARNIVYTSIISLCTLCYPTNGFLSLRRRMKGKSR